MHVLLTLVPACKPFEFFDVRSIQLNDEVCLVATPRGVEGIFATGDIARIDCE